MVSTFLRKVSFADPHIFAGAKFHRQKSLETLGRHFPSENGFAALTRRVLWFSSSEVNSVGILLTQNSYAALVRRVLFSILLTQNQLHCQHFFAVLYCGLNLGNLVPPRWADSHLWLEFALANLLTNCFPNLSAIYLKIHENIIYTLFLESFFSL